MTNLFYAQSGGVTAVINASAQGVIETAQQQAGINRIYVGQNGILGALNEALYDVTAMPADLVKALGYTPGGAFGSCRYKLTDAEKQKAEYLRLIEVFAAHGIGIVLYNGGNDSMDTANKLAQFAQNQGYDLKVIGIPKTIDNDLPETDCCPGFGSAAKYNAISMREAIFDVAAMAATSTKIFVLEVMGRHAGWLTAAARLAYDGLGEDSPIVLLLPERAFVPAKFFNRVDHCLRKFGFCTIAVSEGLCDEHGQLLGEIKGQTDAFAHPQLGGVGMQIAETLKKTLSLKCHVGIADYLQRSARHIASATDWAQAFAVGQQAVLAALADKNAIMPAIIRQNDAPYRWQITPVALQQVANIERKIPDHFIDESGFDVTEAFMRYAKPLIQGENYPPYTTNGLPDYQIFNHQLPMADKKLGSWSPSS